MSKQTTFADILLKIPPYPHGLSGCVEIFFNFKISHA